MSNKLLLLVGVLLCVSEVYSAICAAGEYKAPNAVNVDTCYVCPGGSKCVGDDIITACKGHQWSPVGSSTCENCPAGYKCEQTYEFPIACLHGEYSPESEIGCTSCPVGKYCNDPTLIANTSTGYYSPDGHAYQYICPKGHYCPQGTSIPTACPAKTYQPSEGQTTCISCPLGDFCSQTKKFGCPTGTVGTSGTSCESCPAGYSCSSPSEPPRKCQAGYYSALYVGVCSPCPTGFVCPAGSAAPAKCKKGSYAPENADICLGCPAGMSCSDRKTATKCPSGYFSPLGTPGADLENAIDCHICPAGTYCPDYAVAAITCQSGTYAGPGETKCAKCPVGEYCPSKAVNLVCPEQKYSSLGMTETCHACPLHMNCDDKSAPVVCEPGQYILAGYQTCVDCPAGLYCPNKNGLIPQLCPKGHYSATKATRCIICEPGEACPTPNIANKQTCLDGEYSNWGYTHCAPCPPNMICPLTIGAGIVGCPYGTYVSGNACNKCSAGKYCPEPFMGEFACPAGYFSLAGWPKCKPCPRGFECPSQSTATICSNGQFSEQWSITCVDCLAHHRCRDGYQMHCPVGYFSNAGASDCTKCPDGKKCWLRTSSPDQQTDCGIGWYASPLDGDCKKCMPGSYCPNANNYGPTLCIAGEYQYLEGQGACISCPTGTSSMIGQIRCQMCDAGRPCLSGYCGVGRYSHAYTTSCQDGYPGSMYFQGTEEIVPRGNLCPRGYYCGQIAAFGNKVMPLPCPPGKYGIMEGAVSEAEGCHPCPAGYFCSGGTQDYKQHICPRGYYCERSSAAPTKCPAGTYGLDIGLFYKIQCVGCSKGSACDEGSSMSSVCPMGYYCPKAGEKYKCPAGTYSGFRVGLRDIFECELCPAGYYCPEGATAPVEHLEGYYNPWMGISKGEMFLKCPPGYACKDKGMFSYLYATPCTAGYFCPGGSKNEEAYPCPPGTYGEREFLGLVEECKTCPAGSYCPNLVRADSDAEVVAPYPPCAEGDCKGTSFNEIYVATTKLCPKGYYCPPGTRYSMEFPCPAGTYQPTTGAEYECTTCPQGYACPGTTGGDTVTIDYALLTANATSTIYPCQQGYYCPPGTAIPIGCPPGTFDDGAANVDHRYQLGDDTTDASPPVTLRLISVNGCQPCGLHNKCAGGANSQVACPDGYYNYAGHNESECKICPGGFDCKELAANHKAPCAPGSFSGDGSTLSPTCSVCPIHRYCPNPQMSDTDVEAKKCTAGFACPANMNHYPSTAEICQPGYYCPEGLGSLSCPLGTYNPIYGAKELVDCLLVPAGHYNDALAASTFWNKPCPAGYFCPVGSTNPTANPCPKGRYRSITRGAQPSHCVPCKSGHYCESEGISAPQACTAGYFCPIGSIVPEPCPEGSFSSAQYLKDSRDCAKCTEGKYCMERGQTVETGECDIGYFCKGGSKRPEPTDTIFGELCNEGAWCAKGTTAPAACLEGTYIPFKGGRSAADCRPCPAGKYCLGVVNDGTPTGDCHPGYFCTGGNTAPDVAGGGSTPATITTVGYYAAIGSPHQTKCPFSLFQSQAGKESCDECPAGLNCITEGLSAAVPAACDAGYYCPPYSYFTSNSLPVDRIPCPSGTYNIVQGKTNIKHCLPCPPTKYCTKTGLSTAGEGDCKPGYYCKLGAKTPTPEAVYYSAGTDDYGPCPVGQYCGSATDIPTDCLIGTYNPNEYATNDTFCLACPLGKYCETAGLSSPTGDCSPGYYCSGGGQVPEPTSVATQGGAICEMKNYCPRGAKHLTLCPVGTYASVTGLYRCEDCPPGYFCNAGEKNICEKGYICE